MTDTYSNTDALVCLLVQVQKQADSGPDPTHHTAFGYSEEQMRNSIFQGVITRPYPCNKIADI